MKNATLLASVVLVSLSAGCSCPEIRNPPATMMSGLLGYATNKRVVPRLQQRGVAGLKCFMVPIKNETAYSVPRGFAAMCNDIFETDLVDNGFQLAAKEAVEVIANKVGAKPLEQLFDPEVQQRFLDAIKQDGVTTIDYVFFARLTGVAPSLQIQGKLVSTRPGPDFGTQIPVREEINWKSLWRNHCSKGGYTSGKWKQLIEIERVTGGDI